MQLYVSNRNIKSNPQHDIYLKHKAALTGFLSADNISSYQPADSCHCYQGAKMQERCCVLITKCKCEMLALKDG